MVDRKVKIFLAEDNDGLRLLMKSTLEENDFLVDDFARGQPLIDRLNEVLPDLLVLDYKLPDMKTSQILDELDKKGLNMPFLIVTGHGDEKIAVEMMKRGAADYLIKDIKLLDVLPGMVKRAAQELLIKQKLSETEHKLSQTLAHYDLLLNKIADVIWTIDLEEKFTYSSPSVEKLLGYSPAELFGRSLREVINRKSTGHKQDVLVDLLLRIKADPFSLENKEITHFELYLKNRNGERFWTESHISTIVNDEKQIVGLLGVTRNIQKRKETEFELKKSYHRLYKALISCIDAMGKTTEIRDPYTAGHQRRVSRLAYEIARSMGLSTETCNCIKHVGQVHDIGKIMIPAEIINKPRRLSENERKMVNTHPQVGYDILHTIEFPWPIAEIVLQHHERIDGSGYPHGIKDEDILIEAKIIAVADVVEAMASHRPYRPTLGINKALEEIEKNKGVLYAETVVEHCRNVISQNPELMKE